MWWLRRSTSSTSALHRRNARAAATPAKPPPTITIRFRPSFRPSPVGNGRGAVNGRCRRSSNTSLMCRLRELASGSGLAGGSHVLDPAAGLEQRQQDLVALGLKRGNRTRAHFLVHSGDQLLPD